MSFRVLLFLLFMINFAYADLQCVFSENSYNQGVELYRRKQFLLSVQEFSSAQKFPCEKTRQQAAWGYLLAITELNEKEEMFYLAVKKYPEEMNDEWKSKIRLYQSYYFGINSNTDETLRTLKFKEWQMNLPSQKSPIIAGTLSAVIPGAGQFYVGSWQSGTLAFILNALFLSATMELDRKELHSTALLSGIVFSIAYVGNVLNAAESAKIFNQNYHSANIEKERQRQLPELNL